MMLYRLKKFHCGVSIMIFRRREYGGCFEIEQVFGIVNVGDVVYTDSVSCRVDLDGEDECWQQILVEYSVFIRDESKLAAGIFSGYIYTSADSGVTWTAQASAGSRFWYGIASSSDGIKLVAVANIREQSLQGVT
ncbi:hypothetical protein [Candidatus Magnetomonas plexicatena]|uniref:hypothetical protein n=1 Tax=Candidatus Magnetomonas plexicatena TaxID=2552947 RepID=UPI001C750CB4|nr:hypothetical protein E2O03_007700 [Nitrospirales bacterium LBB_01]